MPNDRYSDLDALITQTPVRVGAAPHPSLAQHAANLRGLGPVTAITAPPAVRSSSPKGGDRAAGLAQSSGLITPTVQPGKHMGTNSPIAPIVLPKQVEAKPATFTPKIQPGKHTGTNAPIAPTVAPSTVAHINPHTAPIGSPIHSGPRPQFASQPFPSAPLQAGPRSAAKPALRHGPANPSTFSSAVPKANAMSTSTSSLPTVASPNSAGSPNAGAVMAPSHPRSAPHAQRNQPAPRGATTSRGTGRMKTYRPTGKRTYIPMNSTGNVAIGGSQDIVVLPQLQLRPDRLVIDATTGALFSVSAIKIGVVPQAAAGGAVSALLFAPNQTASDMALDIANSATQVTLSVNNTDTVAHAFSGALFGDEVEEAA